MAPTKAQRRAAAVAETAQWREDAGQIGQHDAMRAVWPAAVSHNAALIDGGDFPAAAEFREAWLYMLGTAEDMQRLDDAAWAEASA